MVKITRKQMEAIHRKYQQSPDGATSYLAFRRRVQPLVGDNACAIMQWCGMWLGIEPDGYTHS